MKLDADGAAAVGLLDWQFEWVGGALVVEGADEGGCGQLADGEGAVGVFGAAGEGVEEVGAVDVVVCYWG